MTPEGVKRKWEESLGKLEKKLSNYQSKAKTNLISFSELNIVEMTRQRVRKSLESVSYTNCTYCAGKGIVKSDTAIVISALRQTKSFLKAKTQRKMSVEIIVHPRIAQRLVNNDAAAVDKLKHVFKRRITVVSDDTLHIEEIKVKTV